MISEAYKMARQFKSVDNIHSLYSTIFDIICQTANIWHSNYRWLKKYTIFFQLFISTTIAWRLLNPTMHKECITFLVVRLWFSHLSSCKKQWYNDPTAKMLAISEPQILVGKDYPNPSASHQSFISLLKSIIENTNICIHLITFEYMSLPTQIKISLY